MILLPPVRTCLTCLWITLTGWAAAREDLPGGAWLYFGYQAGAVAEEAAIPLHRDVIAVAGGETHSVALKRNGEVVAWGANFDGQTQVPEAATRGVTAIAAGARFTVALKDDGGVVVWGAGGPHRSVPVAARSGVARIAAGRHHILAVRADGSVVAWGNNEFDQCTVPADAMTGVIAVAAGDHHSLALKHDGRVVAWGAGGPGSPDEVPHRHQSTVPEPALAGVIAISADFRFSAALKDDGSVIAWGGGLAANEVVSFAAPGSGVTAFAMGRHHVAMLTAAGEVAISLSGWFNYGQAEVPAAARSGVSAIAAGSNHTLALTRDGTVVAWGAGTTTHPGLLGVGYLHRGQCAGPAALDDGITSIAAGFSHTLALTADGVVHAWGNSAYGEIDIPASARSGISAIAAGQNHSVALRSDGGVVAWGDGMQGQTTVPAAALAGIQAIAAGGTQTLALTDQGGVIGWGETYGGPVTIPAEALSGVTAIAAGNDFAVALRVDGEVIGWGNNDLGQTDIPSAARSGVIAIAAGAEHVLALDGEGRVLAWGAGDFGQTMVPDAALSGVTAIAAGETHSVALKADGIVIAWGADFDGQLEGIPASGVSAIAAGGAASFYRLATARPSFREAVAAAGLVGVDAEPDATPFHDGVPNLLKYAFNLNLAGPDAGNRAAGQSSGLPVAARVEEGGVEFWKVEFIRRKNAALDYTPMKSDRLTDDSFVPMTGPRAIEEIPGFPAWERITIREPVAGAPRFFSRIEVTGE